MLLVITILCFINVPACLELYEPGTEHANLDLPGCDASFTAVQWLTHGVLIAATIAVIPLTVSSCYGICHGICKSNDKINKDDGKSLVKGTGA